MLIFLFREDCPAVTGKYSTHVWANPTGYIQEKYGPPLHRLLEIEP